MRAVKQGDLDALCGVYAIINCLHVLGIRRHSQALNRDMFQELTHALGAVRLLAGMRDGLDPEDLLLAALSAFPVVAAKYDIGLTLDQPYRSMKFESADEFLFEIRQSILEQGHAAVVNVLLPGGYDHWTAPSAIGNGKMVLRDSGRLKSLPLSRFSLTTGDTRIVTAVTLRLRLTR